MRVAAVLTGALDRRADTVIVRLELVRSADGAGLWKRQFVQTDRRRPDPADWIAASWWMRSVFRRGPW